MREEGTERAVVDRIVDGQAVLLVGERETEHHVEAASLPEGVGEGGWLILSAASWTIVGVDETGAEEKREELSGRMAQLRRQRSRGRFNR